MTYLECGQIPIRGKDEVTRRAEELLDECWDGNFPVDVEAICDQLDIEILPVRDLEDRFYIDAYISSDFKTIYVDERGFLSDSPRYRFSLAHELGHYILHRDYFSSRVSRFEEWSGMARGIFFDHAEYEANHFAGSLLAPEGELIEILNTKCNGNFSRHCWERSHEELRVIVQETRKIFRVSEQAFARRLSESLLGIESFNEAAR